MDIQSLFLNFMVYGATTLNNLFKGEQSFLPVSGTDYTKVIVGGYNASIEDYPYQVYYTFRIIIDDEELESSCGGFIVSERYILTAAHCTDATNASTIELRAGSTWNHNGTLIPISKIINHPEYKHLDKDVAILKTTNPITFSNTIQPVKLPHKGKDLAERSLIIVAGWGDTGRAEESDYLQVVEVPVANFDKCRRAYPRWLTKNMFCAGFFDIGGKDSCFGDSGGAAVHGGEAVGIVSFGGPECAIPGFPGVYTRIAAPAIRNFITKHTGL